MIKFVNDVKAEQARQASYRASKGNLGTRCKRTVELTDITETCEKLMDDFNATWKAVLVQLSGEVMNFSNFIKGCVIRP